MYGLVNRAMQSMIREKHGDAVWDRIARRADVDVPVFHAMEAYDDAITYGLLDAAAEELHAPGPALLRAFGHYWIRYAADHGYGKLMSLYGTTYREFVGQLDAMHARVELTFPRLRPPLFRTVDTGPGAFEVHYRSTREGLAPFVVGLLEGLAERFGTTAEVTHTRARAEVGHDVFTVQERQS